MTSILIVADIRLYREGLAQALARQSSFDLIGTAGDAPGAIAQLRAQTHDMVLVDMAMAGSAGVVRTIRQCVPETKLVALSVAETDADVCACAEAGVTGYVPRDASLNDLIATLESAERGEALCSPRMAGSLLRRLAELASALPLGPTAARLTPRESEIMRLLDDGLANKDIARRLGIEVATVKNHVHNILDKLQVHRRAEAAAIMRKVLRTNPTPHLSAAG
ncbi:MAG: DNA-binding response regulator [Gemmatimonadetes bacterium]|nr:MAG: DNA-binding response regulator [Gemmatimonadota bacterium]